MRVYLAGPMTGYPDHNRPAFEEAARNLRAAGLWVLNPAELDEEDGGDHDWSYYLRRDLAVFLDPERDIHAVVVLEGWEESRGARLEVANAQALDIPVYAYDDGFLGELIEPTGGVLAIQREVNRHEAEKQPEPNPLAGGPPAPGGGTYIPGSLDILRPDGTRDYFKDRVRRAPNKDRHTNAEMLAHAEATGTEPSLLYRWSPPLSVKAEVDYGKLGEERVTDPTTGGQKGQKLARLGDLDPVALLAVAEVAGFGARKYARHNFLKGYEWSLTFDAGQRHRLAFWSGEGEDPESGLPHLAHAAWHDLALLAFYLRGIGTDTRPPAAA